MIGSRNDIYCDHIIPLYQYLFAAAGVQSHRKLIWPDRIHRKVLCIVLLQYSCEIAFQRHRSLHARTEVRIGLQPLNAHRLPSSSFDRDESKSEMIWNANAANNMFCIEYSLSLIHL